MVFKMNAFTVDISTHLEDAPKFLKVGPGDKNVFKVDDRMSTVIKIQDLTNKNTDLSVMRKALELALGKEAVQKIDEMDLSLIAFQNIFIGMMAAISGKKFEEMETQFRNTELQK